MTDTEKSLVKNVEKVLNIIFKYSQIDGSHHKAWVIDQITRELTGRNYELFVKDHNSGEDGPETYSWDEGIAP